MSDEDDLPLPPYWRKKESRSRPGEVYYANVKLRITTWIHPGHAKKKDEKKKEEEKKKEGKKRELSTKDDDPQPSFTSTKWSPAEKAKKRQKVEDSDDKTDKTTIAETTRLVLKAKRRTLSDPATLFAKGHKTKEKDAPKTPRDESSETHKEKIPDAASIFTPDGTPAPKKSKEDGKEPSVTEKKKKPKQDTNFIPRSVTVEKSVRTLKKLDKKERRRIRKTLQKSIDADKKAKGKRKEEESTPATVVKSIKAKTKSIQETLDQHKSATSSTISALPSPIQPLVEDNTISTQSKVINANNNNKYSTPASKPAATLTPQTTRKPVAVLPPERSTPVAVPPPLPIRKPETVEAHKLVLKKPDVIDAGLGARLKFKRLSLPQSVASGSVERLPQPVASGSVEDAVPMVAEDVPATALNRATNTPTAQSSETEMEVDVDVDVFHDLMSVRQNATVNNAQAPTGLMEVVSQPAPQPLFTSSSHESKLYIIIDTNVLMHDLNLIDAIKDMRFPGMGRPTLVVPWVVMQELDGLKDGKTGTSAALRTQLLARHPVNYLNSVLQSGHPRVIGQTPAQDQQKDTPNGLLVECNDDRVLHCCLQWKAKYPAAEVILLTLDKNLRTKAIISDIKPCSLKDLMSLLEQGPDQANAVLQNQAKVKDDPTQKLADEIMCELKNLLQVALSVVMETEMRLIYEELWRDIVYRKPPWTLYALLESFNKHWIAVFGSIIQRHNKKYLDQLLIHFKPGAVYRLTMLQVKDMVADCGNFVQPLHRHSTYSGQLDKANAKLELLYKVSRDVANGKHTVAPLNQLATHYETGIKFTAEPAFTEEMRNNVQNAFQVAWENILYCGTYLDKNLFNSDGTRRAEYIFFFGHLVQALTTVNAAYITMLKVHPDDVSQEKQPFVDMSAALDTLAKEACIQPWSRLEPTSLQTYYGMPGNRAVLENGFQQLQTFLTGFNECWIKLTPAEQVELQTYQQQQSYTHQ